MFKDDFRFDVSVSLGVTTSKPSEKQMRDMLYSRQTMTYEGFIDCLEKGHCVAHVFTDDSHVFNNTEKTKANFRFTHYIGIDIDSSDVPMEEYLENIQCLPTFAYHTYSDGIEGMGFRYRLVYVFSEPVYSNEYRTLYDSIKSCAGITELHDDCMKSMAQCMVGNGSSPRTIKYNLFFNKKDFIGDMVPGSYSNNTNCPVKMHNVYRERGGKHYASTLDKIEKPIEKHFYCSLMSLAPSDFIKYYSNTYTIINSSELIKSEDETHYTFPTPYYEIQRGYRWDSFVKDNGEIKPFTKEKRIHDGQRRRYKLFICAVIKCRIKPGITLEELIYNMVWERQMFYDNRDKILDNDFIIDLCRRAMDSDIQIPESKHPSFIVNKEWAMKNGMNANVLKNKIIKQSNDNSIGSWYDCSVKISENLKWAKENNIKISRARLYSWCKENNINMKGDGK